MNVEEGSETVHTTTSVPSSASFDISLEVEEQFIKRPSKEKSIDSGFSFSYGDLNEQFASRMTFSEKSDTESTNKEVKLPADVLSPAKKIMSRMWNKGKI